AGAFLGRRARHAQQHPPPVVAAPPAAEAQPPPPVTPPAAAATPRSHITLHSTPEPAEVKRGGELLGKTPLELDLAADTPVFDVAVSRHGIREGTLQLAPDRSRDYNLRLLPLGRRSSTSPRACSPRAATTAPTSPTSARRRASAAARCTSISTTSAK